MQRKIARLRWKIAAAVFALPCAPTLAAKYGIYDEEPLEPGSSGSFDLLPWLLLLSLCAGAYFYLLASWVEWQERRARKASPKEPDDILAWCFTLIWYALVSVFLALPVLLLVKWATDLKTMKEYWGLVYFCAFAVLTGLRRT